MQNEPIGYGANPVPPTPDPTSLPPTPQPQMQPQPTNPFPSNPTPPSMATPMSATPMPAFAPTTPAPAQNKNKMILLIALGGGGLLLVGGIIAVVLLLFSGDSLSCSSKEQSHNTGFFSSEQYTFHFGGSNGTLSTIDYKAVARPDPNNSLYSMTTDDLYKSAQDGLKESEMPKVSIKKEGDTVVVSAKGITLDELPAYGGFSFMLSNELTKERLKELAEDSGMTCK